MEGGAGGWGRPDNAPTPLSKASIRFLLIMIISHLSVSVSAKSRKENTDIQTAMTAVHQFSRPNRL